MITTQPPALVVVNVGDTATMSVVATASGPLSYQWMLYGSPVAGATSATLVITNVRNYFDVGTYTVVVSNGAGSVTSADCLLRVNFAPYIYTQPESQNCRAGATVTFQAGGIGWPIPAFQWFHNGVAIPGATGLQLQVAFVTPGDAGDYTITLTNIFGTATSQPATLTVSSGLIIATAPSDTSVNLGGTAAFFVYAMGTSITYQWQEQTVAGGAWQNLANQGSYSGATAWQLQIANVTYAMSGFRYRCIVTNSTGTEVSSAATLSLLSLPPYYGSYFGDMDTGGGHWALYLQGTSATFLACLPDRHSVIVLPLQIDSSGVIKATGTELLAGDVGGVGSGAGFTLTGQISGTTAQPSVRTVTGTLTGLAKLITGAFRPGNSSLTQASGDFYTALALKGDQGRVYAIVGYGGDVLAVALTTTAADGFMGMLAFTSPTVASTTGTTPSGATLGLAVDTVAHSLAATYGPVASGARVVSFMGLGSAAVSSSKLANISVRTNAGAGDQTLIVGYVVSGPGSKPVLVRAIGPTLSTYGVTGALANPQLALFNTAGTLVCTNDDWGGGPILSSIFQAVGAFPLDVGSLDAAISTSLVSGPYSAHVSSASGYGGVALLEVYDADAVRTTRLVNLSARALVGTGANVMIAGFVIAGNAPVTLLIRGVGPGLSGHGVTGVLADPRLQIFDANGILLAENDNWGGTAPLVSASTRAGAFPLDGGSKDAALLVTLSPGVYTAQVSPADGTSGVALVEVYELP